MKIAVLFSALCLSVWISDPCQAADVTGRVVYIGERPVVERFKTDSDPHCRAMHPHGLASEERLIAEDGGLQNVFVYVKSGVAGVFEVPEETVNLDQKACRYEPHVFGIRTKQKLEIINSDDTLHNVRTQGKENRSFNLGMPVQNMRLSKFFDKPEIMVKFKCDVHPWMSAYAGVLEHPFFSVTDASGAFRIIGLPAGDYEIEAWHEKFGSRTANLTVVAEDVDVPVGFEFGEDAS